MFRLAFAWLYLVGAFCTLYGVGGFLREIKRAAPDNPSFGSLLWVAGGLTLLAAVHVAHLINRNILVLARKLTG